MRKSNTKEKELYRKNIIEMMERIENPAILNYIYIIVSDAAKEDRTDVQKKK